MVLWAGVVETSALVGWRDGTTASAALSAGARKAHWIVLPLAVFALVWLLTGHVYVWLAAHRGEIDAWFLAKRGWTDVSWFHTTLDWCVWFIRFVCGASLTVALLAGLAKTGARTLAGASWLTCAFHWRTIAIVTAAMFVGMWLPWAYVVGWRPASLPASWVQPAFAAIKLSVVFVVMNVAWACILRRASRT